MLIPVIIGVILGILFRGNFSYEMLLLGVAIYALIPATLVVLIWLIVRLKETGKISPNLRAIVAGLVMSGVFIVVSLKVGKETQKVVIKNTRAYAIKVTPLLRDYREKNGRYPETLKEVEELLPLNFLMKSLNYSNHGDFFQFSYWTDGIMSDECVFESQTQSWLIRS